MMHAILFLHPQHFLQVWEAGNKAVPTSLPPGEVCVCELLQYFCSTLHCVIFDCGDILSAGDSFLAAERWRQVGGVRGEQ